MIFIQALMSMDPHFQHNVFPFSLRWKLLSLSLKQFGLLLQNGGQFRVFIPIILTLTQLTKFCRHGCFPRNWKLIANNFILPLYGCETWSVILREEQRFSVLESKEILLPICWTGRRVIGISGSLIWSNPWWNWYLTPVVNSGDVRMAQLAKFTLHTFTLVPLGSLQIF